MDNQRESLEDQLNQCKLDIESKHRSIIKTKDYIYSMKSSKSDDISRYGHGMRAFKDLLELNAEKFTVVPVGKCVIGLMSRK